MRRLAGHASLAILGGNNENEEALGWFEPVRDNLARYLVDYNNLYVNTVRDAITREIDTDIEYVTSSPSNGPLSTTPVYVDRWGDANDYHYGDVHFYPDPAQLDFADEGTWPRARFVSETGFPSFASRWTMEAGSGSESDVRINGTWMEWRQRYGLNNWVTEDSQLEMSKHFRLPSTTNASLYYDTFAYLSQANQALVYSTGIQAMRRQMSEAPSFTSGILFWQLNDIWQTPSYAAVEYGGARWKLVMYEAARQYQRVIVSGYVYPRSAGNNATIGVYVVNDGPFVGVKGSVEVQLRRWSTGEVVSSYNVQYMQQWYSANQVWSSTVGELLQGTGCAAASECFLYLNATVSNGTAQWWVTNVVLLTPLRDANLQPVTMGIAFFGPGKQAETASTSHLLTLSPTSTSVTCDTSLSSTDRHATMWLSVTAAAASPFSWFEVPYKGRWSDNGLMLLPNVTVQLTWTAWGDEVISSADFVQSLRIRTLWYAYNEK